MGAGNKVTLKGVWWGWIQDTRGLVLTQDKTWVWA